MDQPLFAIAKQIQWEIVDLYGEGKYIVIMGDLHVKMASLKMVGHWLDKSGWDIALVQADITTRGRADGIPKVAHVNTRACTAHEKRNLLHCKALSTGKYRRYINTFIIYYYYEPIRPVMYEVKP